MLQSLHDDREATKQYINTKPKALTGGIYYENKTGTFTDAFFQSWLNFKT
jgi:hypothetical protein